MQSNVECNGSKPTTIIGSDSNKEEFESLQSPCSSEMTDISGQGFQGKLENCQSTNFVLRKRLQAVGSMSSLSKQAAFLAPYTINDASDHININAHLIDSIEYLGSNVEQISMTPSPSPQASPLKSRLSSLISPSCDVKSKLSKNSKSSSNSTSDSMMSSLVLSGNGQTLFMHEHVENTALSPTSTVSENNENTKMLPLSKLSDTCNTLAETVSDTSMSESVCAAKSTMVTFSPPTTSSNGSSTPKKNNLSLPKSRSIHTELLQWKDMPEYLQFNPYVLNGYRPLQTFKGCLFSLFYWHNESINILTHAVPIIYILAIVPSLMPWDKGYRFLSFCHVFGSVAPWCGSFVYHLFMNIERGENFYYRLLKLDMVGIWVSQSFGALPLVIATTFCFSSIWKWFIIISYCLMSLWGLYKALTAGSPWQRRLCFAFPFTMRSILTCLRTLGLVGGNRVALSHVYLQDVVSVLGGAIGAMRIPEKWFPGLVDFYLNSHNIMHVLVVVAVYSMHKATIKDFEWMSATTCSSEANTTIELLSNYLKSNIDL